MLTSVPEPPGPRRMPRPALPHVPGCACCTAAVLKYCAMRCPRGRSFGRYRLPEITASGVPAPAMASLVLVKLSGPPVFLLWMPLNCQSSVMIPR